MTKSEIEKALKKNIIILGQASVKKALIKGKLEKVIISKNNTKTYNEFKLISINTPIEFSEFTSKEQGMICKKPYPISVLGLKEKVIKKKRLKKVKKK